MKHYMLKDAETDLYVAIHDDEVKFVVGSANAVIFDQPVETVISLFKLEKLWNTSLVWESNSFTRWLDR